MTKIRYVRRPIPIKQVIEFLDAEEAWFWYVRSERARREGARLTETATSHTRPCEPDDIYRAVMRLHRRRLIGNEHLKTLAEFGWRECPPDARVRDEERSVALWDDALDRLTTELKSKGIVRHDERCADCG
ncbi:hypothetical protein [Magnetovibrio sp.]|uniref:hypothetical protein n=1 Tax=Magnetovibrio sp. TaxID=2024836 RepID=UPI002F932CA6